jgi:hypothetical protein
MQHNELSPVTLCMAKAGLTAGTTTTYTTANTVTYSIGSRLYSKTAVTNGATPTTDALTSAAFKPISANQISVVVFGFDATGAIKCAQGDVQAMDASGTPIVWPSYPQLTAADTVCPFGYLVLKAGSTVVGTFTFGTNNLSAITGMTYTFQDVAALTGRPVIS